MSQNETIYNFTWNQVPDYLKDNMDEAMQEVMDWALESILTRSSGHVIDHEVHDQNDLGFWPDLDMEHVCSYEEEAGRGMVDCTFRTRVHGNNDDLRKAVGVLIEYLDRRGTPDEEIHPDILNATKAARAWLVTDHEG